MRRQEGDKAGLLIQSKMPQYAYSCFLEIVVRMAMERGKGLLTRIHRVQNRPKNSAFIDVRQNAHARSPASFFSLRPHEGAPVSTPISSNALRVGLRPARWNLESVQCRALTRPPQPHWSSFVTIGAAEEAVIAVLAPIWSDGNDG